MDEQYSKAIEEVVIFNTPIYPESTDDGEIYLPPLGQGYIVTSLHNQGVSARLIDCVYERLSISDVVDFINQGTFLNIGFNVFSVNMDILKSILQGIHRQIYIFLGGKAVDHLWNDILTWNITNPITFIIGEGENIFPDLIRHCCTESPFFDNGLHKVYVVNKNSRYYPADLDSIVLDRTLFVGREELNPFGRYEASLIASRGCIYDCAFCGGAASANPNTTVRFRGIKSLSDEINEIIRMSPQVTSIRILDDLFLRNRDSIVDACKLFSFFPQVHWRCMAHVNTFIHNIDLINQLKLSGCDEVFIGIESGSPEVRKRINKLGSPQDVIKVVSSLLICGISVKGYFMCGLPDETEAQLQKTVDLATELHNISKNTTGSFRATVFQFRPYHGTTLYKQLVQEREINYIIPPNLMSSKIQYNFCAGNYSSVSDKTLENYITQITKLSEESLC